MVFLPVTMDYHHYMMSKLSMNPIPFDCPATYQISVQGRIDPNSSDLLGGMTITPATAEEGLPVTNLEGDLRIRLPWPACSTRSMSCICL